MLQMRYFWWFSNTVFPFFLTNGNSNSSTSCADVLLSFFCFWTSIDTKGKYAFLRRRRRHRFSLGTLKRKKWLETFFSFKAYPLASARSAALRAFFAAEKKCFCFATTKVALAAFFLSITPQYLAKQSSFSPYRITLCLKITQNVSSTYCSVPTTVLGWVSTHIILSILHVF